MSLNAILQRKPPTWREKLTRKPIQTLALTLYNHRQKRLQPPTIPSPGSLKIVCISDTHNNRPSVPAGDLLIHAGDLTQNGTFDELQAQIDWLNSQPHAHKIIVAGNHDLLFDTEHAQSGNESRAKLQMGSVKYLQDAQITLKFKGGRSVSIYGSPWTRKHGNWAFQYPSPSSSGLDFWTNKIPTDTDVLVTHMPSFGHLDLDGQGDESLLQEIQRIKPALHVFGHFHAAYGTDVLRHDKFERAYIKTIRKEATWVDLLCLMWSFVLERIFGLSEGQRTSVLVNASHVGGFKDDLRQEAIVVHL